MVSPMREEEEKKDHENKEDVTYALEERVLQVLKRLCGVETRIVALTRVGSDSREKCLKALARATEEVADAAKAAADATLPQVCVTVPAVRKAFSPLRPA